MALGSVDRKLSFEILSRSNSDDEDEQGWENSFIYRSKSDPIQSNLTLSASSVDKPSRKKRKKKKKKKKMITIDHYSIPEDPITEHEFNSDSVSCNSKITTAAVSGNGNMGGGLDLELKYGDYCSVVTTTTVVCEEIGGSVLTVTEVPADRAETQSFRGDVFNFGELRQRSLNGIATGGESKDGVNEDSVLSRVVNNEKDESGLEVNLGPKQRSEQQANGSVVTRLETAESLDWKRLMAEDPNYLCSVEQSPVKHFVEEMFNGNSLRSTTTFGNEQERERVYDTIFRLPWRCELLINVGFFVCFDSFLSLLTIMPARILMTFWRLLRTRQFRRPSAVELSDFGCFIIMICGVVLLERTDISLIYHMIRGQGTIKLYVVYNVLEIFDKLCQSFSGDVLQTLFNTAEGLANSGEEKMHFWIWRYISDQALAVVASIVHSFVLLAQAITLSTCIVAHNNALLALLVSNNFSEIKSNVFKRFSKENIHSLVYFDSVERFHISAFLLFVLAQNILEAEGPWFESFLSNALLVYLCEMAIDIIKHSFVAKFNDIKPIAFSEFLEDLCKQTLNIQNGDVKKNLTFVPLAPACVVIRVLTPVYAARIPYSPLPWRLFWILLLFSMTYVMLTSLKVLIGLGLHKHATWYINRCQKRRHHLHYD